MLIAIESKKMSILRPIVFFIILLLSIMDTNAQNLKVDEFIVKNADLTARTNSRKDLNGVECALVKVRMAASGASFSGNVMGDVKYTTSEYCVYMPQGSKRLTVKLEGYLPLDVNFLDYGINRLESKRPIN